MWLTQFFMRAGTKICMKFEIVGEKKSTCFDSQLEGAMILWLPRLMKIQPYVNPYVRSRANR